MEWIPEPYPRSGGLAAAGFYKLLGRPRLDPLTVLVRETAQNSWDARLDNGQSVAFGIQGWELNDHERTALKAEVFANAREARPDLTTHLSSKNLVGLYITDRNTKGLSGPLAADEEDPDQTYDWVDFVLNVGKANTQGHTGGTYGFGKTISYVVSAANSVVIHSRTSYRGRKQSRIIACAIGKEFSRNRRLYTGRHWWGVKGPEDTPRPLTGNEADALAQRIGMPQFENDETGTNILIVAPDFGGRTAEQAMRFIAESVTWHLWPKLQKRRGVPQLFVDVYWNGEPVDVPRPEDRPPLQGFAQAFQAILDGGPGDKSPLGLRIDQVKCLRPATLVGELATVPLVHRDRTAVDDGSNQDDGDAPAPAAVITGVCHHVALLRTPELVIDYIEGPAPTEGGTEWAGVFRASDEHDSQFAAAEPPTHDSWNPALLPKSHGRTIVNVGLREIHRILNGRWAQRKTPLHEAVSSTAVIADELAHLVTTVEARGPGGRHREPPQPSPSQVKPKVDVVFTAPIELDGNVGTLARLLVTPVASSQGTRLRVQVGAALDGRTADAELDPQLSLVEARINGLLQDLAGHKEILTLKHSKPIEIDLVVRRGNETTVLFDLDAERLS